MAKQTKIAQTIVYETQSITKEIKYLLRAKSRC